MDARTLIKKHEGLRLKVYYDQFGNATIGYGHKMLKMFYTDITAEKAEDLLTRDIETAEDGLAHIFPWWHLFTENRQAALIDMAFQLGGSGLAHFKKAIAHVRASEWIPAAEDFLDSLWAHQTANRAAENCQLLKEG